MVQIVDKDQIQVGLVYGSDCRKLHQSPHLRIQEVSFLPC